MRISFTFAAALLLIPIACAAAADDPKAADAKEGIVLPKDPKAVVLSPIRHRRYSAKGASRGLFAIAADGRSLRPTLPTTDQEGRQAHRRQVEDLMRFVVVDNDLFHVTEKAIPDEGIKAAAAKSGENIVITGAGTSVITVQTADKKHEVG